VKYFQKLTKDGEPESNLDQLLAVDSRTISNWLSDIKREEKKEEDALILKLWLQCYTQQEIAEKLDKPKQTVSNRLENTKNEILQNSDNPPENIQYTTIWRLPKCISSVTL